MSAVELAAVLAVGVLAASMISVEPGISVARLGLALAVVSLHADADADCLASWLALPRSCSRSSPAPR